MDSSIKKQPLTDDEIKMYREWLSEAEPYTDEEIIDIPFDSEDYDLDRYDEDDDYARGVDDALDDWDEYGEDW